MSAQPEEFPPFEQTDHFQTIEHIWRGAINSEDVELGTLVDVLIAARRAGMPSTATVSIKPGDCVMRVEVTQRRIKAVSP